MAEKKTAVIEYKFIKGQGNSIKAFDIQREQYTSFLFNYINDIKSGKVSPNNMQNFGEDLVRRVEHHEIDGSLLMYLAAEGLKHTMVDNAMKFALMSGANPSKHLADYIKNVKKKEGKE